MPDLAVIRAGIDRFLDAGDPTMILAAEACEEARRALTWVARTGVEEVTQETVQALAYWRWFRFEALHETDPTANEEQAVSLRLFTMLYTVNPPLVPQSQQDITSQLLAAGISATPAARDAELVELLLREALPADDAEAFDAAVACGIRAVERGQAPGPMLHNVVLAATKRWRIVQLPEALDSAVDIARRAAEQVPEHEPALGSILQNLGVLLETRGEATGALPDLDESIAVQQRAVGLTTTPAVLIDRLTNLSDAYRTRYDHSNDPRDVDSAVRFARQATELGTTADATAPATAWSTLSLALLARYEIGADPRDDGAEAEDAGRTAMSHAPRVGDRRALVLSNYSMIQVSRYRRLGRIELLDEGIEAIREAVALTGPGGPSLAKRLANLAVLHGDRYRAFADPDDLDQSIVHGRRALDLAPNEAERRRYGQNLSEQLRLRYELHGEPADLDESIELGESLLEMNAASESQRLHGLVNVSASLTSRYGRTENRADLTAALSYAREAVELSGGRQRIGLQAMTALAEVLRVGYERDGEMHHLDEALMYQQRVVDATAPDDVGLPIAQLNLATSFQRRWEHEGQPADLRTCLDILNRVLQGMPSSRLYHLEALYRIGRIRSVEFTRSGDDAALRAARTAWWTVARAPTARALTRLRATGQLLSLEVEHGADDDVREAAAALDRAIRDTVWLGLSRTAREGYLATYSSLVRDGCGALLRVEDSSAAVELLEAGRAVLWTQMTHGRTGIQNLSEALPGPARELKRVASLLTASATLVTMPDESDQLTEDVDRRMALAREWDELVEQVRAVDGFEDFLRPPRLETLLPAAVGGPVVILNVSRWRCDALIVKTSGVEVVELPDLNQQEVVAQVQAYLDAVGARQGETERGTVQRDLDAIVAANGVEAALDRCLRWMWHGFAARILDHLGFTATPSGTWPRVWWCPTGPLTLLPIHAAGDHRKPCEAVLDRVISSYTPTIRALLEARSGQVKQHPTSARMLFVGMPETPHQAELPNVRREEKLIRELFADRCTALIGEEATRGTVLANLLDHSWVHFACHGEQDLGDPSQGGVLVHDGALTVPDLSSQQYRGDFAYLSGCKTAVGGANLPDEAVTLAAALHYTGYRHVIATLWSIWDEEAAQVSVDVYRAVVRDGVLHADGAAEALHHAVRRLRDKTRDRPSAWIPFAHTGP